MINIVWAVMMTASILYMIFTGNSQGILDSITLSASRAVTLCISLTGIYCFWLGIMNIANSSGLNKCIARLCAPIASRLFKGAGDTALSNISMNIASNLLGLGNAATPYGLKAMEALHAENRLSQTPSHNMVLFAVINAASVQLIPTTIISLRASHGSASPTAIVITTFITTFTALICGVTICKLVSRLEQRG